MDTRLQARLCSFKGLLWLSGKLLMISLELSTKPMQKLGTDNSSEFFHPTLGYTTQQRIRH